MLVDLMLPSYRSKGMQVVKPNTGFTAIYNGVGLTLAALGYLSPILAAAQPIPDLGILIKSSRLLRQKRSQRTRRQR